MNSDQPELPAAALSGDPIRFGHYLTEIGQDYLLVDEPAAHQVRVRFVGALQGQPVVWDCRYVALAGAGTPDETGCAAQRNYIEVGAVQAHGVSLQVGLNVAFIDRPAIEKMIIMVRNYKRLRPGRHEYGPAGGVQSHTFTPQRSK